MIRQEQKLIVVCDFCKDEDTDSSLTVKMNKQEYHLCFTCRDAVEKELKELGLVSDPQGLDGDESE